MSKQNKTETEKWCIIGITGNAETIVPNTLSLSSLCDSSFSLSKEINFTARSAECLCAYKYFLLFSSSCTTFIAVFTISLCGCAAIHVILFKFKLNTKISACRTVIESWNNTAQIIGYVLLVLSIVFSHALIESLKS